MVVVKNADEFNLALLSSGKEESNDSNFYYHHDCNNKPSWEVLILTPFFSEDLQKNGQKNVAICVSKLKIIDLIWYIAVQCTAHWKDFFQLNSRVIQYIIIIFKNMYSHQSYREVWIHRCRVIKIQTQGLIEYLYFLTFNYWAVSSNEQ